MSVLDGAIASRLQAWTEDRVAERLWAKDGSLWAASGKAPEDVPSTALPRPRWDSSVSSRGAGKRSAFPSSSAVAR